MSATQEFIRYAFGLTGTRAAIPEPVQVDGSVSWQDGYGLDYQRQKTDPLSKPMERDKMNALFYRLSLNQQQYQLNGSPEFVPAADNGGVAVAYRLGARTYYPTDGFDYAAVQAGVNVVPGTDATKWRRRLMEEGGLVSLTVTGNIPSYAAGSLCVINAAGATTQTLPAANSVAAGERFRFFNMNAGVGTVQRAGADTIQVNAGTVTSLTLGAGDTLVLRSDGVSKWHAVGGSAQLASAAAFAGTRATSGYQRFPGGLILQWGTAVTNGSGIATFTFPIAFPTAGRLSFSSQSGGSFAMSTTAPSTTSCTATAYVSNTAVATGAGQTLSFFVIGD